MDHKEKEAIDLVKDHARLYFLYEEMSCKFAECQQERDTLRDLLYRLGKHSHSCNSNRHYGLSCTCGLTAALAPKEVAECKK